MRSKGLSGTSRSLGTANDCCRECAFRRSRHTSRRRCSPCEASGEQRRRRVTGKAQRRRGPSVDRWFSGGGVLDRRECELLVDLAWETADADRTDTPPVLEDRDAAEEEAE